MRKRDEGGRRVSQETSRAVLKCSKCGQDRPVTDFDARFVGKGTRINCAACRRAADEKWQERQAAWEPQWEAAKRARQEREQAEAERRERMVAELARRGAERDAERGAYSRRTEGHPTDRTAGWGGWIDAYRTDGDYPKHTERGGKWMVFLPVSRIDAEWERAKAALDAGRLGRHAKVSTRPNTYHEKLSHVLIIYTYDSDDVADVWRVRQELRAMGYTWPMGWKADSETRQLHYAGPGRRISRYWG